MWLNPCHFANKGCNAGDNCRFTHCKQVEVADRLLRTWDHDFPNEAGALIKVYREALRVVNSINPNPQMLNTPIRCRADQRWLNVNQFHPPTQRPVLAVNNVSLPKAIPAIPPMNLQIAPLNQAFPEGVEMPQPYQNDVVQFLEEEPRTQTLQIAISNKDIPPEVPAGNSCHGLMVGASPLLCGLSRTVRATQFS